MKRADVIIVGGGVAGIATAVRLAERGVRVQLMESRKKLGGRATSFADARSGLRLDNCQHVALGCCANYLDLCDRLGVGDSFAWYDEQHWIEEGGRVSTLRPGVLPAPGHFTGSFLAASFLTMKQKVQIARASLAMMGEDREAWAERTFGEFLEQQGQDEQTIGRYWSPVVVSACNLDVNQVSASAAMQVFQEGFFANRGAARIGVPRVPLVELYEGVAGLVEKAGGVVLLGESVQEVGRDFVKSIGAGRVEAEDYEVGDKGGAVVLAVPFERVSGLISEEARASDGRFEAIGRLEHSSILGVHLIFDEPVMELPHAVLVERGVQWVFCKDEGGRHVHAVISAADAWMGLGEGEIVKRVLGDFIACFPAARDAGVLQCRVVKERRATFAPTPGHERFRPEARGTSGIVLAGDYTRTGWPATMEGAVRSGYKAAAAVLGEADESLYAEPVKVGVVAQMLGL